MKKSAPILLLVLFFSTLNSQYSFHKLCCISYGESSSQIKIRKEYDGTYGPRDFLCRNGALYIFDSENNKIKIINESGFVLKEITLPMNASNLVIDSSDRKIVFNGSKFAVKNSEKESDASFLKKEEEKYIIYRKTNNSFNCCLGNNQYQIKSDLKIASVRLLGVDKYGNLYFDVESFISEIPCEVKRDVCVLYSYGQQKVKIRLPFIYYAHLERDLYVDEDGNIYHLLANKTAVELIEWKYSYREKEDSSVEIRYPDDYESGYHYNIETKEQVNTFEQSEPVQINKTLVTRDESLEIANTYYVHDWQCQSANLSNGLILAGGKYIRTPDWIVVGNNRQVPYQWEDSAQ